MLRICLAAVLILGLGVLRPAVAADGSVSNSGNPNFSLLVPDGWQAGPHKAPANSLAVSIKRGSCSATLWVRGVAETPGAVLVNIRPQLERQSKAFQELSSGPVMFGDHKGAFGSYVRTPLSGAALINKVVTTTDGQYTYTLFIEGHIEDYAKAQGDLDRIQASLKIK